METRQLVACQFPILVSFGISDVTSDLVLRVAPCSQDCMPSVLNAVFDLLLKIFNIEISQVVCLSKLWTIISVHLNKVLEVGKFLICLLYSLT